MSKRERSLKAIDESIKTFTTLAFVGACGTLLAAVLWKFSGTKDYRFYFALVMMLAVETTFAAAVGPYLIKRKRKRILTAPTNSD